MVDAVSLEEACTAWTCSSFHGRSACRLRWRVHPNGLCPCRSHVRRCLQFDPPNTGASRVALGDVVFDSSGQEAIVRLRDTKAGARQGVYERVVVRDEPTLVALRFLCLKMKAGDQLLQLDERSFRKLWHRVVKALKVQDFAIRSYSLRRGGSTWWFRATLSYDAVAERGRWSNVRTCRRYVEDAAAQLTSSRFTTQQEEQLKALGERYRK